MALKKISKLDAARMQISTSIDLLFNDDDPVSAHTLAGAASGLLHDLVNKIEPNSSLEHETSSSLDESLKDLLKRWRKPQNFFKHANWEEHDEIEFNPYATELLIFAAITNLKIILDKNTLQNLSDKEYAFILWKFATHRASYEPGRDAPVLEEAKSIFPGIMEKTRAEQLEIGKKFINELKSS